MKTQEATSNFQALVKAGLEIPFARYVCEKLGRRPIQGVRVDDTAALIVYRALGKCYEVRVRYNGLQYAA